VEKEIEGNVSFHREKRKKKGVRHQGREYHR